MKRFTISLLNGVTALFQNVQLFGQDSSGASAPIGVTDGGASKTSLDTLISGENGEGADGWITTRKHLTKTVVTFTDATDVAIGADGSGISLETIRVLVSPTANMLISEGTVAAHSTIETLLSSASAGDEVNYHGATFDDGLVLDPVAGTNGSYLVIWSSM